MRGDVAGFSAAAVRRLRLPRARLFPLRLWRFDSAPAGRRAADRLSRVEDVTIAGIIAAKRIYEATDLRQRLARYHPDPDAVFAGWHERWLDPAFRGWSIEALLPAIGCPLLAVQGFDDEYGSMAQLDGIKRRVPQTELLKLVDCRHSPHRDQPQAVIEATCRFVFGDRQ